ncbi:MAG: DUF6057 family protein [Phocaeicola sp.]
MKNRALYLEWSMVLFTTASLILFFSRVIPYHLYHREQTHLFLHTLSNYTTYLEKPALLSSLMGDFLTPFFYHSSASTLILTASTVGIGTLCYLLLKPSLKQLALLPALGIIAWEVGRISALSYPLSSTLSLLGALGMALLCRKLMERKVSPLEYLIFSTLTLLLTYYLWGYGMWIVWLSLLTKRHLMQWLLLLLPASALPMLMQREHQFTWKEAASYPSSLLFALPNLEREAVLKADIRYSQKRTNLFEEEKISNPVQAYYANLTDAKIGRLPYTVMDRCLYGVEGLFLPVNPTSNYYTIYAANEVWYALGDMTMTEHATLLGMIFSPKHSGVRALKRLAEVNLINGDEQAALKYLRILQNSWVYKQWAENRIDIVSQERTQTREPHIAAKEQGVVQNRFQAISYEWEEKRHYIPQSDTIRMANDIVKSLRQLLQSNHNNRMAMDYLLCYHLLKKDVASFIQDLQQFNKSTLLPPLYAEALLIHLAATGASKEEVEAANIPIHLIKQFNAYNQVYQREQGDGHALVETFKKSYWFYYHYAQPKDEL